MENILTSEDKCKINQIIKKEFESSTIHAIPNIIRNKSYFFKFFWTFWFIASSGVCLWFMSESIITFFDYEVVNKISAVNKMSIEFPTVTICNLNFATSNFSSDLYEEIKNETYLDISQISYSSNKTTSEFTDQSFYLLKNYLFMLLAKSKAKLKGSSYVKKLGLSLNEMLIVCLFNAQICSENDFEYFYSYNYGNCFKFNYANDKFASNNGKDYGLVLQLYVAPSSFFSVYDGLTIFIGDKDYDLTTTEGIDAPTGFSTNVAIQRVTTESQPKPYSECTENLSISEDYDSLDYKLSVKNNNPYNRGFCFRMCFRKYLENNCNCTDSIDFSYYGIKPCLSIAELQCTYKAYSSFINNKVYEEANSCDCPIKCKITNYFTTVSLSKFPSLNYANVLLKNPNVISKLPNATFESLKENILSFNVYYNDLTQVTISESPKILLPDLIANLGGTLGLFLGKIS